MIIHVHIWETLECLWERYKTTVFSWNFQLKTYWNLHTWEVITLIIQLVIHILRRKRCIQRSEPLVSTKYVPKPWICILFNYLPSEKSIALKRTSNCCFFSLQFNLENLDLRNRVSSDRDGAIPKEQSRTGAIIY